MTIIQLDANAPDFTRRYPNLADPRLGAATLACSDDFFAEMSRMLNPDPAVFIVGKYDTNGKWMDGWESRRKRVSGYDWCVLKLARAGVIKGVDIDTSHFTGNYPPAASLEAAYVADGAPDAQTEWQEILPSVNLQGNSHHYHEIKTTQAFTHLRLNIYPDGGVARLRVYGQPQANWDTADRTELFDLISVENGGYVVAAANQHFGLASNMLMPGRGVNMGDGWETRRRREPGNDWCIIALAHPGIVEKIEVDTCYFKGNFPDACSIQAAHVIGGTDTSLVTQAMFWPILLSEQKLQMDHQHYYADQIKSLGPITHIRFNIVPDGGVSRLRLWSRLP
ncbi:allantoicase [Undibacterium sp. 5I1]|uniref:allantoicase n=1 Tax=unclassified Undibacterium TaxID=2630295 RepID=UPI002AB48F20|nr:MULTISPECIES: allantoicase [unclassified Undibacterium]MDY7540260.1 allantoicase [Undibacterium sp. 5I1]MEB0233111.1 allantoicase [Undibacterium sp. 10I3]MEB0259393.1 allantoicase [Undibacterium sp. 5I1]